MESKRRPGDPRSDSRNSESNHTLVHKSDPSTASGAASRSFNDWGSVVERRTEASEQVMNTRKLAPLKGSKRHDPSINNPFAPVSNPFASLGQHRTPSPDQTNLHTNPQPSTDPSVQKASQPSATPLSAQSNLSNSIFGSSFANASSSSQHSSSANPSNPFSFGSSQANNTAQSHGDQTTPFVFGQKAPAPPPTFHFGDNAPSSSLFSFGGQTTTQSPIFSFGSQNSDQPKFSFGSSQSSQQQPQPQNKEDALPKFSFGSTQPTSNIFSFPQKSASSPDLGTSKQHQPNPQGLFTLGSKQPDIKANETSNIFGLSKTTTNSAPESLAQLGQSTSNDPVKSVFSNQTSWNQSNAFSPLQGQNHVNNDQLAQPQISKTFFRPAASQNSNFPTAVSPTKPLDTDTIMSSPPKNTELGKFSFDLPNQQPSPTLSEESESITADAHSPSQKPADFIAQAPKFAPITYDGGPFQNPFSFPSVPSSLSSSKAPSAHPIAAASPNSNSKTSPSMAASAHVIDKSPSSSVRNLNDIHRTDSTSGSFPDPKTTSAAKAQAIPALEGRQRELWDRLWEFRVMNHSFRKHITALEISGDLTSVCRQYITRAKQINRAIRPSQYEQRQSDLLRNPNLDTNQDGNVEQHTVSENTGGIHGEGSTKNREADEGVVNIVETPGKSKTSSLFASIIGDASSPPKPDHSTPFSADRSSKDSDSINKTTQNALINSDPDNVAVDVSQSDNSTQTPREAASTIFSTPAIQRTQSPETQPQTQNAIPPINFTQQESVQNSSRSLFDRIAPGENGSRQFENPFANLDQNKPEDLTWKADTPIKFGSSEQNSSLLFPSLNRGSPATSRATTPGTMDGGLTSEAESAPSNVGETDGINANEESEPAQAQVDLTVEDPKQQILFESEKVKASIKNPSTKSWDNRGVGPLRIMKHEESGKVTILMRVSPSGKVVFHSALIKELSYTVQGASALVPTAGEGDKLDTWAIRFKTRDVAEAFVDMCEELK